MGQLNFFNRRDQNPCYFSSNLVAFWNREFTAEFMNKSITRNESMILCYSWVTWYTSIEWACLELVLDQSFCFSRKKKQFFSCQIINRNHASQQFSKLCFYIQNLDISFCHFLKFWLPSPLPEMANHPRLALTANWVW